MKRLIFIEINPSFNRFDIIERITHSIKRLLYIDDISILLCIDTCKLYRITRDIISIEDLNKYREIPHILSNIIDKCSRTVILTEYGKPLPHHISKSDCYIAGLHTDIPRNILNHLLKKNVTPIKLSNNYYLASMIPFIIDFIIERYDTLLMSININYML